MARSRRRAVDERQELRRHRRRLERRRSASERLGTPEQLEQRQMLALSTGSLDEVRETLRQRLSGIEHVTVVTHGFQLTDDNGDSLLSLAQAVRERAGSDKTWLLDYDVFGEDKGTGRFDTTDSLVDDIESLKNVVLLWDWAPESNEWSAGWTGASADALFATLADIGLVNPAADHTAANTKPAYHFIGHSFGAAVTSEVVRRFAAYDVPVDHVTYLDPHDFDEEGLVLADFPGIDTDNLQAQYDVGIPKGYGAAVWGNVAFADVYYQTSDQWSVPGLVNVPQGRPIPGAYNKWLSPESLDLPGDNSVTAGGDHSDVWEHFYLQTIKDTSNESGTGYAFSRIAGDVDDRPDGNFFAATQDHTYSDSRYVTWDATNGRWNPNWAGLESLFPDVPRNDFLNMTLQRRFNAARWEPQFDVFDVYNGSITHAGNAAFAASNYLPGWNNHGGTGAGETVRKPGDSALKLSPAGISRTHNRLYVPGAAAALTFTARTTTAAAGDRLVVKIGDTVLSRTSLDADGVPHDPLANGYVDGNLGLDTRHTSRVRRMLAVPAEFLGKVNTLTFAIERLGGGTVAATVEVDDIRFLTLDQAKDIKPWPRTDPLTLQEMRDKLAPFLAGITGVTVVTHGWQF
jgi:hypothetical protein